MLVRRRVMKIKRCLMMSFRVEIKLQVTRHNMRFKGYTLFEY